MDHERLEVYQVALEFLVLADQVIEHLPRGRGHLADQLTRASISIVLNIAEGAGKFSKLDKRRYYLAAVGSSTESAAILDVCERLKLVETETHKRGKALLQRVVSMLVRLARNLEKAGREGEGERERVREGLPAPPLGGSRGRS